MILKYCFKDEIHKSFCAPPTFISLLKEVTSIFGDRLPPTFSLQYRDNDGDFVTISSDIEYLSMIKFDLPRAREMVRIFIIPSHQSQMMEADVKPVDLSLSSKKSSDGSFEVIEENSQNTSGNISEFSLASADSPSKKSKTSSEASSTPKIIKEFDFHEESSSNESIDFDQSVHSHNDTIDKIEAKLQCQRTVPIVLQNNAGDLMDDDDNTYRAGELMDDNDDVQACPMIQNNAGDLMDDDESSSSSCGSSDESEEIHEETMRVQDLQTSLDKILNFIQPADCSKSANLGKASPTQYYSLDNSVLSKEINQAAEELAAIRIRRIINRLKNLQPPSDKEDSPSFTESVASEEQEEESLDLHDIKPLTYTELGLQRRARIMSIVSAALIIQTAYRRYRINKLMKVFRDFEASYPLITEEDRPMTMMRKDQGTQMIPMEYQYEFSESNHSMSEASSFSIKIHSSESKEEEWNLQKIQPKDYRVVSFDDSHEQEVEESPMKKCYHCEDFEYCEHYHSGYNSSKPFNDSHMINNQNYRFKAPCKFNYIPSPILKGRYDSYFMQKKAETNFNYRLLPGMSSTPVFMSSIDDKKIAYKTVYLINTGSRPWRKCYVKAMGPIFGKTAEIYNIDVGQIALATLELNGHYGAESYKSQWKIIHENENGMMEAVGEPFEVDITFEVKENMIDEEIMREMREQGQSDQEENNKNEMSLSVEDRKMDEVVVRVVRATSFCEEEQDEERNMSLSVEEKQIKPFYNNEENDDEEEEELEYEDDYEEEEDVQEEIYEEEESEGEEQPEIDNNMQFGAYQEYLEEIAKVKEIGRHFPCDPWDEIFDFVLERAYMSIEQIYEEYVSYRNAV